jgi:hypothetical protein
MCLKRYILEDKTTLFYNAKPRALAVKAQDSQGENG